MNNISLLKGLSQNYSQEWARRAISIDMSTFMAKKRQKHQELSFLRRFQLRKKNRSLKWQILIKKESLKLWLTKPLE